MPQTPAARDRLSQPGPALTPRQREVLDLLVRGRTNAEIGEALGISLDGAKWHVSEVISKLGVDSREEAAEYWRARNGLRLRFTRALRGLVFGLPWLKMAAGIAVFGATSAVGVALFLTLSAGSPSRTRSPSVADIHATPGASPGAAATPSPVASTQATGGPALASPGIMTTPVAVTLPSTAQISAPSSDIAWALVANKFLFRSTNGATTWQQRPLPALHGQFPGGEISFVDSAHGWVLVPGSPATQCQAQGIDLWRTTDGGATWETLSTPTAASSTPTVPGIAAARCKDALSFVDPEHGFIAAWDPNSQPVIYRTSDGGSSWTASAPLPDPPGEQTHTGGASLRPGLVAQRGGVLLVDAVGFQHLYVYRSTDGGAIWSYAATVPNATDVGDVAFLDATHWWAVGQGLVDLRTADAGRTWQPASGNLLFAATVAPVITFTGPQVGYAAIRGAIARTTDGGLQWNTVHTPGTSQP